MQAATARLRGHSSGPAILAQLAPLSAKPASRRVRKQVHACCGASSCSWRDHGTCARQLLPARPAAAPTCVQAASTMLDLLSLT
jgi:hypothetical protein